MFFFFFFGGRENPFFLMGLQCDPLIFDCQNIVVWVADYWIGSALRILAISSFPFSFLPNTPKLLYTPPPLFFSLPMAVRYFFKADIEQFPQSFSLEVPLLSFLSPLSFFSPFSSPFLFFVEPFLRFFHALQFCTWCTHNDRFGFLFLAFYPSVLVNLFLFLLTFFLFFLPLSVLLSYSLLLLFSLLSRNFRSS